jgi:hypothetical protein
MLKAVLNGNYFKNGRRMLTYKIMGPTAEIEEYKIIESARLNKLPEQLANVDGFPLLFLAWDQIIQSGDTPKPSYNLVKNFAGTGYNRDTLADDMAKMARVSEKTETAMAEIQAKRALGIDVGDRATRVQRVAPAPTQAAPAVETTADDIAGAIAEGANLAENGEAIPAGEVGNETLAG